MRCYAVLWVRFEDVEFNRVQAIELLPHAEKRINLVLSRLRRAGWLSVKLDTTDARKRRYQLKFPETIMREIVRDGKDV